MSTQGTAQETEQHLAVTAKQSGPIFLYKLLVFFLGFLASYVLARYFGAKVIGQYAIIQSTVGIASILTIFGLDVGLVKYIPAYKSTGQEGKLRYVVATAFRYGLGLALAGTAIIVLSRHVLAAKVFKDPELSTLFLYGVGALVPITLIHISGGLYKGSRRAVRFIFHSELSERIIFMIVVLALAALGMKQAPFVVMAYAAAYFVVAVLLLRRVSNLGFSLQGLFLHPVGRTEEGREARKALLAFSSTMIFILFANILLSKIDIVMIGYFMPSEAVGVYKIAFLVSSLALFLQSSTNMVFPSIISEMYATGKVAQLGRTYSSLTKWLIVLTLPTGMSMVLFPEAILSFFGPEYVSGTGVLVALAVGSMVNVFVGPNGFLLNMSGHERLVLINNSAMAVINILLNLFLIPRLGIAGAAIATAISISSVSLLKVLQVRHYLGFWPYDRTFWHLFVSLGVILAAYLVVGPYVTNAFAVAAFTLVALGITAAVAAYFRDELDTVLYERFRKRLKGEKGAKRRAVPGQHGELEPLTTHVPEN